MFDARAVIATVVFGALLYAALTFVLVGQLHQAHPAAVAKPWHFLHLMFVTVWACVGFALALNRLAFGRRARFGFDNGPALDAPERTAASTR